MRLHRLGQGPAHRPLRKDLGDGEVPRDTVVQQVRGAVGRSKAPVS